MLLFLVVNSCDFSVPPGLKASTGLASQQLRRQIKHPHKLQRQAGSMMFDRLRSVYNGISCCVAVAFLATDNTA